MKGGVSTEHASHEVTFRVPLHEPNLNLKKQKCKQTKNKTRHTKKRTKTEKKTKKQNKTKTKQYQEYNEQISGLNKHRRRPFLLKGFKKNST